MFYNRKEKSFVGVAIAVILIGAAILAFGVVGWWINVSQQDTIVVFPSMKIMGGLVITSLGYIQLELGLLRDK